MINIESIIAGSLPEKNLATNNSLFYQQTNTFETRVFQHLNEIQNLSKEQTEEIRNLFEQKVQVFTNLSRQLQRTQNPNDEEMKEFNLLLQLLSNGFGLLIKQMAKQRGRSDASDLAGFLATPAGSNYKTYIQKPLAELQNAFVSFVTKMVDVNETRSIMKPLTFLVKMCCKYSPFMMMGHLFYTTTIRKARDTNYFFQIYNLYLAKNSKIMLNSFKIVLADILKVLQMLRFCNEVTDAQEFGFKYASTPSMFFMYSMPYLLNYVPPKNIDFH